MAIYTTDSYTVESIMNVFTIENFITTWDTGMIFIKGLPEEQYRYTVPVTFRNNETFIQEDFDNYDRFIANVIPVFESTYINSALNNKEGTSSTTANSAISPLSMYLTSTSV